MLLPEWFTPFVEAGLLLLFVKEIEVKRRVLALAALALLAACGGGGGSSATSGVNPPPSVVVQPSVSGDMLAYQANRGWNYQGNVPSLGGALTMTVYADAVQSGVEPLILFGQPGALANAFAGTKMGGIGVTATASEFNVVDYVLLNGGAIYAEGAISPIAALVPSTLTLGATFQPYPGASATVEGVGNVPGANACPTPATGATVQYTFMNQTYSVSYVPGCGITQYVGNNGETLTLASVGSYPNEGLQSVRRMDNLTILDSVRSLATIIAHHLKWTPKI